MIFFKKQQSFWNWKVLQNSPKDSLWRALFKLLQNSVNKPSDNILITDAFSSNRSASSDLISRRGVFSRRHYGSVEMVSTTALYFSLLPTYVHFATEHQQNHDLIILYVKAITNCFSIRENKFNYKFNYFQMINSNNFLRYGQCNIFAL